MTWSKKPKPILVRNASISNGAFEYLMENRRNKHEPIYKIIDRIILEHRRLVKE
ncbi:MAG: hypothetical protein ACRD5J_16310 [Nitrososphaeraceae archaeon]